MKYLIKKNLRRLGNVGETIDLTPLAAEKYLANNAITEYKEDDNGTIEPRDDSSSKGPDD